MTLTPLGIYGAYPQAGGGTSAYLVQSEQSALMLDFGSGALSRLQSYLPPEELNAIVLTHLHSDHMSDMLNLRYYLALKKIKKKLPVYLPQTDTPEYALLAACSAFELRHILPDERIAIGDFRLQFYEMAHPVLTYGVQVKNGDGVLGYSADSKLCSNLYAIAEGSDLFLCDAAVLQKEDAPSAAHVAVGDAAAIASRCDVPMLLTHLSRSDNSKILSEALTCGADARIIEEMVTYTIKRSKGK